jgi:hypothetical protein
MPVGTASWHFPNISYRTSTGTTGCTCNTCYRSAWRRSKAARQAASGDRTAPNFPCFPNDIPCSSPKSSLLPISSANNHWYGKGPGTGLFPDYMRVASTKSLNFSLLAGNWRLRPAHIGLAPLPPPRLQQAGRARSGNAGAGFSAFRTAARIAAWAMATMNGYVMPALRHAPAGPAREREELLIESRNGPWQDTHAQPPRSGWAGATNMPTSPGP